MDSLNAIMGTGRVKTAGLPEHRRYQILINSDQK